MMDRRFGESGWRWMDAVCSRLGCLTLLRGVNDKLYLFVSKSTTDIFTRRTLQPEEIDISEDSLWEEMLNKPQR